MRLLLTSLMLIASTSVLADKPWLVTEYKNKIIIKEWRYAKQIDCFHKRDRLRYNGKIANCRYYKIKTPKVPVDQLTIKGGW